MVGQTILHYRLIEKLGAGGMGEIYKAEDSRLKRVVAIKVLSPRLSSDPERRKRFIQEARAASALNHPNIITLYDIITEGDLQCIVMEYIAGKTLRDMIPNGGLRAPQALQYAVQMASALAAAHTAGIIHRDLKPSNVMITPSGLAKILDFGLAKWIGPSVAGDTGDQATVDEALTTEGSIIGTVSYMSPEQAVGKRVDTRSDIFSFGSVMYEMVTGRRAFEGTSGISTLSSILRDDVTPINDLAPSVPSALEQIILRCLAKDPDARWQSMKEIEGRLVALDRQMDSTARSAMPALASDLPTTTAADPAPPPPPKAKPARAEPARARPAAQPKRPTPGRSAAKPIPWIWAAAGAVLIASAGVGGWYLWRGQHQPAPQAVTEVVPAPVVTPVPAPAEPQSQAAPEPAPGNTPPAAESAPAPAKSAAAPKKAAPKSAPANPNKVTPIPAPKAAPAPETNAATPAAQPALEPPPPPKPTLPAIQLVPVTVGDALPFRIVLAEDVPADVEQGKALRFTVADGLKIGNNVVIAKGATVAGAVAREAGKKKFIFGGAKTTFELQLVEAVDGKKLNVRATSGRSAEGPATRSFDTGKGSKPKGLAAAQGTEYIAYIDGDQTVSVSK